LRENTAIITASILFRRAIQASEQCSPINGAS
jgi:hypothetical protein